MAGKGDGESLDADAPRAMNLLLPHNAVGVIIGQGGVQIAQLKEQSGANVRVSQPKEMIEQTQERIGRHRTAAQVDSARRRSPPSSPPRRHSPQPVSCDYEALKGVAGPPPAAPPGYGGPGGGPPPPGFGGPGHGPPPPGYGGRGGGDYGGRGGGLVPDHPVVATAGDRRRQARRRAMEAAAAATTGVAAAAAGAGGAAAAGAAAARAGGAAGRRAVRARCAAGRGAHPRDELVGVCNHWEGRRDHQGGFRSARARASTSRRRTRPTRTPTAPSASPGRPTPSSARATWSLSASASARGRRHRRRRRAAAAPLWRRRRLWWRWRLWRRTAAGRRWRRRTAGRRIWWAAAGRAWLGGPPPGYGGPPRRRWIRGAAGGYAGGGGRTTPALRRRTTLWRAGHGRSTARVRLPPPRALRGQPQLFGAVVASRTILAAGLPEKRAPTATHLHHCHCTARLWGEQSAPGRSCSLSARSTHQQRPTRENISDGSEPATLRVRGHRLASHQKVPPSLWRTRRLQLPAAETELSPVLRS